MRQRWRLLLHGLLEGSRACIIFPRDQRFDAILNRPLSVCRLSCCAARIVIRYALRHARVSDGLDLILDRRCACVILLPHPVSEFRFEFTYELHLQQSRLVLFLLDRRRGSIISLSYRRLNLVP